MAATPMNSPRLAPRWGAAAVAAAALLFAPGPDAVGQNPEPRREGLFVTVPNPITDAAVEQIKSKVQGALKRQGLPVATVVFDFNPGGQQQVGTSDFDACNRLRRC